MKAKYKADILQKATIKFNYRNVTKLKTEKGRQLSVYFNLTENLKGATTNNRNKSVVKSYLTKLMQVEG